MAVHALRGAGLDPAYVVGGELRATGANAGWGTGEWIVIEADESDRSLLKLHPEIAVLTNAELDHHSTYGSRLDLEETFAQFMARAGERAVVWDRPALRALCPAGAVPYDAPDAELHPDGSRFAWRGLEVRALGSRRPQRRQRRRRADRLRPGRRRPGGRRGGAGRLPRRPAADGAARGRRRRVRGLRRLRPPSRPRWRRRSRRRARWQPRRLVAVFQPHLYSRTRALARAFGAALAAADAVVVLGRSTRRASAPRTSRASTGAWSPPRPPTPLDGRPVAWMPGLRRGPGLPADRCCAPATCAW